MRGIPATGRSGVHDDEGPRTAGRAETVSATPSSATAAQVPMPLRYPGCRMRAGAGRHGGSLPTPAVGTRMPPHEGGRLDPHDRVTISSAPCAWSVTGARGWLRFQRSCGELDLRCSQIVFEPCTSPRPMVSLFVTAGRCRAYGRPHRSGRPSLQAGYAAAPSTAIRAGAVNHGLRRSRRLRVPTRDTRCPSTGDREELGSHPPARGPPRAGGGEPDSTKRTVRTVLSSPRRRG